MAASTRKAVVVVLSLCLLCCNTFVSFLRFLSAIPLGDDAQRAGVLAELEQLHFCAAVVRAEPQVRDQHHGAAAVHHHGIQHLPFPGRREL